MLGHGHGLLFFNLHVASISLFCSPSLFHTNTFTKISCKFYLIFWVSIMCVVFLSFFCLFSQTHTYYKTREAFCGNHFDVTHFSHSFYNSFSMRHKLTIVGKKTFLWCDGKILLVKVISMCHKALLFWFCHLILLNLSLSLFILEKTSSQPT